MRPGVVALGGLAVLFGVGAAAVGTRSSADQFRGLRLVVAPLGMTPMVLQGLSAVLLWRIGRRLFPPAVAASAAVVYLLWPQSQVVHHRGH